MKITFLEANQPLTKKFEKRPDGSYIKHSYPFVKLFTSHEENPKNLSAFAERLKQHAIDKHCLLKGNVSKPLVNEPRSGSTDPLADTEWVVFDVDGMANITTADEFITKVLPKEFQNVSYIIQRSASAGISSDGFRAHIFFLLSRPYSVAQIKVWLQYQNLTEADLATQLSLSKNAITLRYPLDITVNQNDKLIYIAPPTCIGFTDPFDDERIELVSRENDVVSFDFPAPSSAQLSHLVTEQVNILRVATGLTTAGMVETDQPIPPGEIGHVPEGAAPLGPVSTTPDVPVVAPTTTVPAPPAVAPVPTTPDPVVEAPDTIVDTGKDDAEALSTAIRKLLVRNDPTDFKNDGTPKVVKVVSEMPPECARPTATQVFAEYEKLQDDPDLAITD